MELARILFATASRGDTGTIVAMIAPIGGAGAPTARETLKLEIEGGYVYSIHGGRRWPRAEDHLRDVLHREALDVRFLDREPPLRLGRCPPFQPAAAIRNHVEARLGAEAGASFRARAGEQRLRLGFTPHASCLGRDERPIVTLLSAPRTLAELDATRFTTAVRIERLCAFLEAVGCIQLGPSPYEILGLGEGVSHEEVRRAYKRLVRELHPDLRPAMSEAMQREMDARFAAVLEAYRRLVPDE